jgi:uroporphyrinogen decarboxylase
MTSRQIVRRAIRFERPDRLPYDLPEPYGTDFAHVGINPSPDARPRGRNSVDEWGAVWDNIGVCNLGEVKDFPLKDWKDFDKLHVPDIRDPKRWGDLDGARQRAGDKFLLASGISIYERVHFIRGLQNTWMDIHDAPDHLGRLIDILVDMNLYAIERFAAAGADGLIFCDDWGLQNRLMISPASWRRIWKSRYARIYDACHKAGLLTFLHSCGYIVDILDDLIEIGLDVIHMDQQENMGLDLLSKCFAGRLTFWAPVDIQMTMARGTLDQIRAYCHKLDKAFNRDNGGFIPRWYGDPKGAGHRPEAVDAMADEFLKIVRASARADSLTG